MSLVPAGRGYLLSAKEHSTRPGRAGRGRLTTLSVFACVTWIASVELCPVFVVVFMRKEIQTLSSQSLLSETGNLLR